MAEHKKDAKPRQNQRQDEPAQNQAGTSGVRHVGKTLESDPEYNERPGLAQAPERGLIDRSGNDLTASPQMYAGSDPLVGTELSETGSGLMVEPLKTRLPGDTSSDPHTDLGSDNATK